MLPGSREDTMTKTMSKTKFPFWMRSFCILMAASLFASCGVLYMRGVREEAEKTILAWDRRVVGLSNTSGFSASRGEPVPIQVCPETFSTSHFAVVGMITASKSGSNRQYQISAAKLMVSIRTWSPKLDVDMIMLIAVSREEDKSIDKELLIRSGWRLCNVGVISSPPVERRNRFLDSDMFTRLILWKLTEYQAVLSLDSDLVVSKDISPLFLDYYPQMVEKRATLAATRDALSAPCTNPDSSRPTFNAGVLMVVPNRTTFAFLNYSVFHATYDYNWAEQGLLNSIYTEGTYVELPFLYNAHMAEKRCNSTRWREIEKDIAIFHYTVVKGWSLQVVNPGPLLEIGSNGFNVFGAVLWDALLLCYIWELIPIM